MIYTPLTAKALNTAYTAHMGQTDRSGIPYIFHPYHVAEQMETEETAAIALLHDVCEDTDITPEQLLEMGFPENVVEGVRAMTHKKDEDYFDYIRRIKSNPAAVAVKLADLRHNSDTSRLSTVTEKDIARLKKYRQAERILTDGE